MREVQVAHTASLTEEVLREARALLYEVFDDMAAEDWEHALGGMHALAWEDGQLVGHAALVQRRLLYHGRAVRTGYVEGVGVRADRRRRGHGGALMQALEGVARRGYDLAALASSDAAKPFYAARGWRLWRGPSSVLTPVGIRRTEDDDGCIHVLPGTAPIDVTAELTCDWRDGDVW